MGAPVGNRNATKNRPWREALDRALLQFELKDAEGKVHVKAGEALRAIADKVVQLALSGDKDAYKEVANRLDGSPDQNVNFDATTTFAEAVSGLGAFLAQTHGIEEAGDHAGVGEGGSVLSPPVPPTTH